MVLRCLSAEINGDTVCFSSSTVEQEQIQKKTFTNWVNAQLAKVSRVTVNSAVN